MYAGIPGMGATDAWHEAATLLEEMKLDGQGFCVGVADIAKFFDQIVRPLVYCLARTAGMPLKVLTAYQTFLEQMLVLNTLERGHGEAVPSPLWNPTRVPMFNDIRCIDYAAVGCPHAFHLRHQSFYTRR